MPAHLSHLLQPLNIGFFLVLKRAYSEVVESQTRLGIHRVDKNDFLKAYRKARIKAFTEINIVNSFAGAGIKPFDPQRVISKLDIRLTTPPRHQAIIAIQAAIGPR
jgi:DNA invertase Pin-like site-specific DNA recombinase